MSAAALLDRLERVKQTGPSTWLARCPAHPDKSPSLSVRELDDGRVLVHDFGGCGVHDVLAAVGLELSDLYPPKSIDYAKPAHRPFPPADILRLMAHESLIVSAAAHDLASNKPLSDADLERLILAESRIATAARIAGGSRHG